MTEDTPISPIEDIIEDARQGLYGLKLARDQAVVDPGGCSDYYDPWKAKEERRAG